MSAPRLIPALLLAGFLGSFIVPLSLNAQGPPPRTSRFGLAEQDDNLAVLDGQVKFSDGNPAEAAVVQLVSSEGEVIAEQRTDPSGHFSFTSLQRGNYSVVASMIGYHSASSLVAYSDGYRRTIELTLVPDSGSAGANGSSSRSTVSVSELEVPEKALREYRKGIESLSRKKISEAQGHFEAAIQIDPQFNESYQQLGLLFAEQGQYPRAEETLQKAIQIDGKNSSTYAYLGYVYQRANQTGKAERAFRQSIGLSDANWLAQMGLGQILIGEKQPEKGLPHLFSAQKLHPGDPAIYLMIYNALISLDRGPEALTELDEFLARFPKDPMAPKLAKVRKGLAEAVREADHR